MNKKLLIASVVVLALVLVPMVAAAPSFAQNVAGNGDTLQSQDQLRLQIQDCTNDCVNDPAVSPSQTQTSTQTRQELQTCACNNCEICNDSCLQTQTRNRACQQQSQSNTANALEQNSYCYQHQIRLRNQTP